MIYTQSGTPRSKDLAALLDELRALIQEKSISRKLPGEPDYVLASGKHSRYYCDTKKVTLSPAGALLTGEILFTLLDGKVDAVGGLQLGATFIATAVALVSGQHGRPIYGFTVREQQKKHGTKENIATSFSPNGRDLLEPGRPVAIVDDVVTEGGSILQAVRAVQERGCNIVSVVSMVDRNQGGGDHLRDLGLPYFALFNAVEPGILTTNDRLLDRPEIHRIPSA